MNYLSIGCYCLIILLVLGGNAEKEKEDFTFREYIVCGDQAKRGKYEMTVRIKKEAVLNDTTISKLYFNEAVALSGNEYCVLKEYDGRYFIGLDTAKKVQFGKESYLFIDLSAPLNTTTKIEHFFTCNEVYITLVEKVHSEQLQDSLLFYKVNVFGCGSHTGPFLGFVFSKKNGFLRLEFDTITGCLTYYYPERFLQKHKRSADRALSRLFKPLVGRSR